MKKKIYILFILLSINVFSQREADHWYFGDKAGLHFNAGRLDILNDSKMSTFTGSSSISDKQGNLIFYTNGQTVWNKNHQIIEDGENLAGELTNTQSSIIIPKPNSETNFYIFNTRQTLTNTPLLYPGIYYSEIEISSTYPSGKVIKKNERLEGLISQKITAVHHKNGKDIWVITYGKDVYEETNQLFYTFKVTEFGINSGIKTELNEIDETLLGKLKVSPNGSKVALSSTHERIHLYKFNNITGSLSEYSSIFLRTNITQGYLGYGLTFSPNSKYLYYPAYRYTGGKEHYKIFQAEIDKLNASSDYRGIPIFTGSPNRSAASIQLASDGKIYVAQVKVNNFYDNNGQLTGSESIPFKNIGVINEPNKFGEDSNYQDQVLNLENGNSHRGLPNFIQSYFRNRIITENKCVSEVFDFNLDAYKTITAAKWDFGDGNTATSLNTNHKYTTAGTYIVTSLVTMDSVEVPFYKEVIVYPLPEVIPNQELIQCDTNNDGVDFFDLYDISSKVVIETLDKNFIFYKSYLEAENDENRINNPELFQNESIRQELFVSVISEKGCRNITNFFIESKFVSLGNISTIYACDNSTNTIESLKGVFNLDEKRNQIKQEFNLNDDNTIQFYPSLIEAQTTTNLIEDDFTSPTTTIYVRVDTPLGCGGIEPFNLVVNTKPIININDSYIICVETSEHSTIIIDGNSFNDRYEWRTSADQIISTNKDFLLNSIGTFSLTAFKTENGLECSSYKEFTVAYPKSAEFNQIIVDTETENNTISVNLNGDSNYEFSLDNKTFFGNGTDYTFNNVTPGLRTIYVKDINNCEPSIQTNASVIGFKRFFSPNGDGNNDYWNLNGIDAAFFKSIKIIVFDRYGKVLHSITGFNSLGWNGIYNGKVLASNSYWFTAEIIDLEDNLIKKSGSFSLIRK
ncbi:T9SS type B sorting domain-containing protein [Polaribacter sp. SA4-12]|uniref:T9SS type B sorting domain-containing protein n=1 Tax=Polaribacter sp. SA4-12 TaxID=1312072 RepID=UPI000B3D25DB|nr:T9SS type B sorting domain-containing protein [Polaribacter sp. SA4-12]ARV14468.1 hypothetical protein BTO07_04595 [Polaribacter sp. SA4-12]